MKKTLKRTLSWILVIMMTLSCMVTAVSADATAPTIDGVKDDLYTNDKVTVINTAYTGVQGTATTNTLETVITTWYTWDDSYNYVFVEITGQYAYSSVGLDVVYYMNHANGIDAGYMFNSTGGGYIQYDLQTASTNGAATTSGSVLAPAAVANTFDTAKGCPRTYEFKFDRNPEATGFSVSPVVTNGPSSAIAVAETITYGANYNATSHKVVKYDDATTWREAVGTAALPKLETEEPTPEPTPSTVVIDGVKDDTYYSEDKKLVISTPYTGVQGTATTNTLETVVTTYYTWDDDYNYVYVEITGKYAHSPQGYDIVYYMNHTNGIDAGYLFNSTGGGYFQYELLTAAAYGAPNASSGIDIEIKNTFDQANGCPRTYEFKFARDPEADGFTVSPVVQNGPSSALGLTEVIAYGANYNATDAKVVKYNDQTTWAETKEPKEEEPTPEPDVNAPDGVKDDRYTDDKKLEISTAFAGVNGTSTENIHNMKITAWYNWDDTHNYAYIEVADPDNASKAEGANAVEAVYFKDNTDPATSGVYIFAAPNVGGGYAQNTLASGALSTNAATTEVKFVDGDGVRAYELRFPRNADADGFMISPVSTIGSDFAVAYGAAYNTTALKTVKYEDNTTWAEVKVPAEREDTPPVVAPDGLDALMDDRYSEERMTEISKAFAGSGQSSIVNAKHIYSKTYYAWDETNNYIFMEIHDPTDSAGLDILYYISNTNAAGGIMFQQQGGGYIQFDTTSGEVAEASATLRYASYITDEVHYYEIVIPKSEGAIGMMISPVAYRDGGKYTVSYDTNYYMVGSSKVVLYENQANHWTDSTRVDPDVMNDPAKIEAVETELKKLPEDVSTLDLDDKALVDGISAVMDTVPDSWSIFIDEDLMARYKAAKTRVLSLLAESMQEDIEAVETKIAALPETVGLENKADVDAAKAAADALGEVVSFVDADLMAKLNAAVSRVEALSSPIKVDGLKDPAYETDEPWDITLGFLYNSSSDIYEPNPDTYGVIYTMADDNYAYVYIEVFDDNGIVSLPEDEEWSASYTYNYDSLTTYIDMDPSNVPFGVPYQDCNDASCTTFYFTMLADGTIPDTYLNSKNTFLTDATYFVPFTTEKGYGYEMKLPRVDGEESFKINTVISDPIYVENEEGEMELSPTSLNIALGQEWAYNYNGYGEKFYDDYQTFSTYLEVIEMINSLPAAEDITDRSCAKTATAAREALDMLNVDQKALVSDEIVKHLTDVEAKLETIPETTIAYGDLNNDKQTDAKDALIVLKISVGKQDATADMRKAADVSGDGLINASDALQILKKAVGKLDKFTVEE